MRGWVSFFFFRAARRTAEAGCPHTLYLWRPLGLVAGAGLGCEDRSRWRSTGWGGCTRGRGFSRSGRWLLGAQFDHFGDALHFVLLCHLPVPQGFFLTGDQLVILLQALGVVGGDALHLGLNAGVFLGLASLEFFQLFLL